MDKRNSINILFQHPPYHLFLFFCDLFALVVSLYQERERVPYGLYSSIPLFMISHVDELLTPGVLDFKSSTLSNIYLDLLAPKEALMHCGRCVKIDS